MYIKSFVFNPFQVNCYVVYDDSGDCIIIDASCYEQHELEELTSFIEDQKLTPLMLVNTHGHVDHLPGNAYLAGKYSLKIAMHKDDVFLVEGAVEHGLFFGFNISQPPLPVIFPEHGTNLKLDNSELEIRHAPGHSPGSVVLYSRDGGFVVTGDVLFAGSIGRTDLPGGNYDTLINSIREQVLTLPGDTVVYPGHGLSTTIDDEIRSNPFLR